MTKECTDHHLACACREEMFEKLIIERKERIDENYKLQAERDRYKEALLIYGDPDNWKDGWEFSPRHKIKQPTDIAVKALN